MTEETPEVDFSNITEEDMPSMAGQPKRLTSSLVPMFRSAFEKHGKDEAFTWELGPMCLPDGERRGAFIPLLVFYASLPGALIGTSVVTTDVLDPTGWTADRVDEKVHQVCDQLREARSEQLAQMNEQVAQSQQNDAAPPTHGLIVPGRS